MIPGNGAGRMVPGQSSERPIEVDMIKWLKPVFAWFDLWAGGYWDRTHFRLYVLPIPCVGACIQVSVQCHHPGCKEQAIWCTSDPDHAPEIYCPQHAKYHGYCEHCGQFVGPH